LKKFKCNWSGTLLQYTETIEQFYEAAANPELWSNALEALSTAVGCRGALLTTPVFVPGGLVHTASLADPVAQFFEQGWYTNDLRNAAVKPHHWRNGFFSGHSLFSDEEIVASDYYENFARNADVPWFAAGRLKGELTDDAISISLQRSAREGAFTVSALTDLNRVLPRLQPTMALATRLADLKGKALMEGLQLARQPSVLIKPNGTVAYINPAADALLGKRLSVRRQRLVSADVIDNKRLQTLIDEAGFASESFAGDIPRLRAVVLSDIEAGTRLVVTAAPFRRSASDVVAFAGSILMFSDLNSLVKLPIDVLQSTFDLTYREASVMSLLGEEQTIQQIAFTLGIAIETVRHHVKTIFGKTGTRRQSEVVAICFRIHKVLA
jgi:DNA-binding CsgD family transcriptional regulator